MKYKVCLFDFDYTLADATIPIVECFRYTFLQMDLDCFDRDKVIRTVGMTLKNAFITLSGIYDEEKINEFLSIYKEKSNEITIENTVLFDDTLDTLKKLKNQNIKIGIVSSRMGSRIKSILTHLGSMDYIDYVIGFEDVSSHKPNPEGLNMAMEYFNINKEYVLYVGDSIIDAQAAENGKVDFIGVTTGTTSKDEFDKYNNIKIVSNLSKILEVI